MYIDTYIIARVSGRILDVGISLAQSFETNLPWIENIILHYCSRWVIRNCHFNGKTMENNAISLI